MYLNLAAFNTNFYSLIVEAFKEFGYVFGYFWGPVALGAAFPGMVAVMLLIGVLARTIAGTGKKRGNDDEI